jgi:hypothetical protein
LESGLRHYARNGASDRKEFTMQMHAAIELVVQGKKEWTELASTFEMEMD